MTVLDISPMALEQAKARLGTLASSVRWLEGHVTTVELPPATFAFWHDRALFHFLRGEADRARQAATLHRSVPEDGHVLIGPFGPEGPKRCIGLEVVRYSVDRLSAQFGEGFEEVDRQTGSHVTPFGRTQQFIYWHAGRVQSVANADVRPTFDPSLVRLVLRPTHRWYSIDPTRELRRPNARPLTVATCPTSRPRSRCSTGPPRALLLSSTTSTTTAIRAAGRRSTLEQPNARPSPCRRRATDDCLELDRPHTGVAPEDSPTHVVPTPAPR